MNWPFHQRQRAVGPQRHGRHAHLVFLLNYFERFERIALVGPLHRKLGTRHQVIHIRQHAVETVIDRVDIHGDGHARLSGDSRGMLHGGGVVAIDV